MSAEAGETFGHVAKGGVVGAHPAEVLAGAREVAGPLVQIGERVPEPEVELLHPLHAVGAPCDHFNLTGPVKRVDVPGPLDELLA